MTQPHHTLVTHAGAFHADEIMALVLLERFYLLRPVRVARELSAQGLRDLLVEGIVPRAASVFDRFGMEDARTPHWIVRTRSPETLAWARANPEVFVIDVGGEFDPTQLNFDHHQGSMRDTWPCGTPFSSTGLLWKWLDGQGHLDTLSKDTRREIEQSLIIPLDAHDNGLRTCLEGQVCEAYNRPGSTDEEALTQFEKAKSALTDAFDNHLHLAQVKLEARKVLENAWKEAQARGDAFVVLQKPLPYPRSTQLLKEISNDEAQLLALPGKGNRFSLISLPENEDFSIKCPTPERWRGRMDFDEVVDGQTIRVAFAHKNGFMCVVEGNAAKARLLAQRIVSEHHASLQHAPRRTLG